MLGRRYDRGFQPLVIGAEQARPGGEGISYHCFVVKRLRQLIRVPFKPSQVLQASHRPISMLVREHAQR